jgi:hypothetical protein
MSPGVTAPKLHLDFRRWSRQPLPLPTVMDRTGKPDTLYGVQQPNIHVMSNLFC